MSEVDEAVVKIQFLDFKAEAFKHIEKISEYMTREEVKAIYIGLMTKSPNMIPIIWLWVDEIFDAKEG